MDSAGVGVQVPGDVVDDVLVDRVACSAPAFIWTPTSLEPPWPVILFGHGNAGGKDEPYVQVQARRFARGAGAAVVVMDGPIHGERSVAIGSGLDARVERQQAFYKWIRDGDLDGFVAEWREA